MDPNIIKLIGILDPHGKYPNPLTGYPYSPRYSELAFKNPKWTAFRTYEQRIDFFKGLINHQIVIAIAGTGTGKTVVIPRLVNHFFGYKKGVFLINPKKSQCIKTAAGAALFADVDLGKEVGHVYDINSQVEKVKDDEDVDIDDVVDTQQKAWKKGLTKLVFCTDNWMQAFIKSSPDLAEFGGVIMDEIHERTVGQDFLLALFCNIAKFRPDFRIVLMSATLDPKPFMDYFKKIGISSTTIEFKGEQETIFNLSRTYMPKPVKETQILSMLEPTLKDALVNIKTGNIIVFIPAVSNLTVLQLKKKLESESEIYNPRPIFVLFGGDFQRENELYVTGELDYRQLKPDDGKGPYGRMVIFSTNVGEAAITFADISCVIDTGMRFRVDYDPHHYASMMGAVFIAQSNIAQRCGRTGRTRDGVCIALYSKDQYDKLIIQQPPEIEAFDLTNNYLDIITHPSYGSYIKAEQFFQTMITPPSDISKYKAMRTLLDHDLVSMTGNPTTLGYLVNRTKKFDFRICKMLIAGLYFTTDKGDCITPMVFISGILHIMGNSGLGGLFKTLDKNRPDYNDLLAKQKGLLNYFKYPNSDHITAYNIYSNSRNPEIFYENPNNGINTKYKARKAWCEAFMIDVAKLNAIDVAVFEIKKKFLNAHYDDLLNLDVLRVANSTFYQNGGGRKSKKKQQVVNTAKRVTLHSKLSGGGNITREALARLMKNLHFLNKQPPVITTFKDIGDNILACIFYASVTNLGIMEDPSKMNGNYLIKFSNNDIGKPVRGSLLSEGLDPLPLMIMYHTFTLRYGDYKNPGELSFVSGLPEYIITKFALELSFE
jgi:HrpA-like RNA helicase